MKIQFLSDIHLEFNYSNYNMKFSDESDMVIICGDICPMYIIEAWNMLFNEIKRYNKPVYYIPGNHDFYRSTIDSVINSLKQKQKEIPNFFLVNDDLYTLPDNNTLLFGGTMWSDFNMVPINPFDPNHESLYKTFNDYLCDFTYIRNNDGFNLTPKDCKKLCIDFKNKLKHMFETHIKQPILVCTHFACHPKSIHPKYKDNILNPYFITDCSEFFEYPNLIGWLHGHTHASLNYTINNKFVKCNPRGIMKSEFIENGKFDSNLIIEL